MGRRGAESRTTRTVVGPGNRDSDSSNPQATGTATTSTVVVPPLWARPCRAGRNPLQEDQTYLWETLGKRLTSEEPKAPDGQGGLPDPPATCQRQTSSSPTQAVSPSYPAPPPQGVGEHGSQIGKPWQATAAL